MPFTGSTPEIISEAELDLDAQASYIVPHEYTLEVMRLEAALAGSIVWQEIQKALVQEGPKCSEFAIAFAAGAKRLENALRRNGYTGEVDLHLMLRAWVDSGLPVEDFGRSNPRDLIQVLEAKAKVLKRIQGRGTPTSNLLLKRARFLGGRPEESCEIDGGKVRALRARGISQKALGRALGKISGKFVTADRVRRAEQGNATDEMLEKLCQYAAKHGQRLSPADFKKPQR